MNGNKYTYYLCFITMLMSLLMYSNEPPLPKPYDDPGPYPELPINVGLSYLFIAGVAYGIYAIKKNKKLNGL